MVQPQLPLTQALQQTCLHKNLRYVGTRGNTNAPVCFLGEAPGVDEDRELLPFVGASGKELWSEAQDAGFTSNDCWFTNVYKVRPPENDLTRLHELGIPKQDFENQLLEELNDFRPTIIISCGATPTAFLAPRTASKKTGGTPITKWRGSLLSSDRLGWPHYIIPIMHPAFILRDWSERSTNVLCLGRAWEELEFWRANGHIQPLPERQLIAEPTFSDCFEYLRDILDKKLRTSIDIEMLRRRFPYLISFAISPASAISITLTDYQPNETLALWRLMDEILRTLPQIGQNYTTFDANWLRAVGFKPNIKLVDDTLIMHHVLWPELSHKLEFLGLQYTRQPYWKDEGRTWRPGKETKQFKIYNCVDAAVTYECYLKMLEELNER